MRDRESDLSVRKRKRFNCRQSTEGVTEANINNQSKSLSYNNNIQLQYDTKESNDQHNGNQLSVPVYPLMLSVTMLGVIVLSGVPPSLNSRWI